MKFHPALVHFPVALFIFEAFLVALWKWKKQERFESFAYLTLKCAIAIIPLVILAGLCDAHGLVPLVRSHALSGLMLVAVNGSRLVYRWRKTEKLWTAKNQARLYLVWLGVGVALTFVTADLGGGLVYE